MSILRGTSSFRRFVVTTISFVALGIVAAVASVIMNLTSMANGMGAGNPFAGGASSPGAPGWMGTLATVAAGVALAGFAGALAVAALRRSAKWSFAMSAVIGAFAGAGLIAGNMVHSAQGSGHSHGFGSASMPAMPSGFHGSIPASPPSISFSGGQFGPPAGLHHVTDLLVTLSQLTAGVAAAGILIGVGLLAVRLLRERAGKSELRVQGSGAPAQLVMG